MSEENRKWLERLIKENKESSNELTYTYCPFEVLYQLQQENQQLKMIIEEYERLNKENGRGFIITSVKQYDIDELLKYKNNWDKLKEFIVKEYYMYLPLEASAKPITILTDKMQELERGSDSNGQ